MTSRATVASWQSPRNRTPPEKEPQWPRSPSKSRLKHDAATRRNIPTTEFESVRGKEDKRPVQLTYERRNRDLDPQLVYELVS